MRSGPEVFVKIHWTMNFQNSLDQIMLHGAGIFTYIWVIFEANVGKYAIHGAYGLDQIMTSLGNPSVASVRH